MKTIDTLSFTHAHKYQKINMYLHKRQQYLTTK